MTSARSLPRETPKRAAAGVEPLGTPSDLLPVDHRRAGVEQGLRGDGPPPPGCTARHRARPTASSGARHRSRRAGRVASLGLCAGACRSQTPAETVPPVAGLITAEFEPPLEAIGGLGVETNEEVVLEVSGDSEFRVPDASEDFKSLAERLSAPRRRPRATPLPEAAPRITEDASKTAAEPEPESTAKEEQTIGRPATRRLYLASETKGRSVASFFHSLLAARPPAEAGFAGAESQVKGAGPARSPQDAGSLSSLAGDDNLPTPPAVPAADQKADGAVSFDDFFGSEAEGSTPKRQRADPGKDDLDQFQTWLQNLKR